MIFRYKRSKTALLAVLSASLLMLTGLAGVSDAWAAQPLKYRPTAIEPTGAFEHSRAYGINNSGQVAGHFYNWDDTNEKAVERQAYIWEKQNGATPLSTLSGETTAWGINDNAFVAGSSWNAEGDQRAVRWDTAGDTVVDIGAFTNTTPDPDVTGNTSTGFEINNLNKIVGNADIPNDDESFTPFHAFLYDDSSGIEDLGTFTTAYPAYQNGYSIAYGINNDDIVVGGAHNGSWTLLPFVWDATNGLQELSRNPSYSGDTEEWYAVVINDEGLIGGHVITAGGQRLLHYWPDASADPVEIPLPAAFPNGEIYGINTKGQMVGIMWDNETPATEHAFVYDAQNGVQDLNDLIPSGSGWVLEVARDINDTGQISGWGQLSGQTRGFVLRPQKNTLPIIIKLLLEE